MPDQRFRGDNVEVIVTVDGRPKSVTKNILSFEFTEQFATMARDYLARKSPKFDETYNGVAGKIAFDPEGRAFFKEFIEPLKLRAKLRLPGLQINIKTRIAFNDGTSLLVVFPDVKFDPVIITVASRTEHGTSALDFKLSDCTYI